MKNSIRLLAILLAASFTLTFCDKDDEAAPATLYDALTNNLEGVKAAYAGLQNQIHLWA